MTIRNTTLAAVLAAVLAPVAPALAGQEYELPDSLARLELPADPNEFVRQAVVGEQDAWYLLLVGCPSEGGWAGAAFAALKHAAETDPRALSVLAGLWYDEQRFARREELGIETAGPSCPSDFPRATADVWLAGQLRAQWEHGKLATAVTEDQTVGTLFSAMSWATAPEAFEVVRGIARDPEVDEWWRQNAARRLRYLYFGMGDRNSPQVNSPEWERYVAATRAALFDLAAGPPIAACEPLLGGCEWDMFEIARGAPGEARDAFEQEYERVLRAAGREPFWR